MKRLIAKRITAFNKEVEQFIQQCQDSGKFNDRQMEEIRKGFEQDLTMEQVKLYAKPEFKNYQMWEIRWGFKHGLTIEQVKEKYNL